MNTEEKYLERLEIVVEEEDFALAEALVGQALSYGWEEESLPTGQIVADRREAEERIRTLAAPQNIARHPGFRTPCAHTGTCMDCNSPDRICNTRMEMLRCYPEGRILVILIDEELGL